MSTPSHSLRKFLVRQKEINKNEYETSTVFQRKSTKRTRGQRNVPSSSQLLICSYNVKLPLGIRPYQTQRTMIVKILTSLKNKLNALIESPTGSGKTLALLSAVCAWLENYKVERAEAMTNCQMCRSKNATSTVLDLTSVSSTDESDQKSNASLLIKSDDSSAIKTIEEEFDDDFESPKLNESSRRSSILTERKKSFMAEKSEKEKEENVHTCLPKVTVYYGTRTHKQIDQVVKEFSRLPYGYEGMKHTILASREHSCINKHVRLSGDVTAKCREITAPDGIGCSYRDSMRMKYERASRLRNLISEYSIEDVWDIEDLVEVLRISSPAMCPYYAATRVFTQDADIVFCPFSYLLDPIIRDNSEVSLKNSIVILDEAHNIEDVCREASSFTFVENEIIEARDDLRAKSFDIESVLNNTQKRIIAEAGVFENSRTSKFEEVLSEISSKFRLICKFFEAFVEWYVKMCFATAKKMQSTEIRCTSLYSWEYLFLSLETADLLLKETKKGSNYSLLMDALSSASSSTDLDAQFDLKPYKPLPSSLMCIEKCIYFLRLYSQADNRTAYKLFICIDKPYSSNAQIHSKALSSSNFNRNVVESSNKTDQGVWLDSRRNPRKHDAIKPGFRVTLHLWSMRPSLAFLDAFVNCRNVILASGTLCPIETFQSELGVDFKQKMEGNQVIDAERIFAAVIPAGPTGYPLCATYKNVNESSRFIRELSLVIKSVCLTVPKGVLVFLTSYRMLEQLYDFMDAEGILQEIRNVKHIVREPKRSSKMNDIIMEYDNAILNPKLFGSNCDGALMLAVFRGKVSEGVDFADDRARCVITVGIPFPNVVDEQVLEKKRYNDENSKKLSILCGSEWYAIQAYRALNQALGRCLRHREDWGAILMIDERLSAKKRDDSKISKWIREQLRPLKSFNQFVDELAQFVSKMQVNANLNTVE